MDERHPLLHHLLGDVCDPEVADEAESVLEELELKPMADDDPAMEFLDAALVCGTDERVIVGMQPTNILVAYIEAPDATHQATAGYWPVDEVNPTEAIAWELKPALESLSGFIQSLIHRATEQLDAIVNDEMVRLTDMAATGCRHFIDKGRFAQSGGENPEKRDLTMYEDEARVLLPQITKRLGKSPQVMARAIRAIANWPDEDSGQVGLHTAMDMIVTYAIAKGWSAARAHYDFHFERNSVEFKDLHQTKEPLALVLDMGSRRRAVILACRGVKDGVETPLIHCTLNDPVKMDLRVHYSTGEPILSVMDLVDTMANLFGQLEHSTDLFSRNPISATLF